MVRLSILSSGPARFWPRYGGKHAATIIQGPLGFESAEAVHSFEHGFSKLACLGRNTDQHFILAFGKLLKRLLGEVVGGDHHVIDGAFAAGATTQSGIDDRRGDLDHSDAGRLELMSQTEREGMNRGLGRAVDRHVSHGREGQARTDVNHIGLGLKPERRQQVSNQVDGRNEIDRHFLIQAVRRGIGGEVAMRLDAGIVDKDVQGRMMGLQPLNQCTATERVGHVADVRNQGRHGVLGLPQGGLATAADDDLIACTGKALRQRHADACRAASNKNGVVCKFHRRLSFGIDREGAPTINKVIRGHTFATGKPG